MVVFVILLAFTMIEDIILYNYQYIIILILFFKNYNQGYLHWVPSPEYIFVEYQPDRLISLFRELELELIQTQMAQKPMLRAEVGMRVRCANKASAE